ncbi:Membrane protein involved in the export of O-antigen and teichoic acid [Prevotella aff. ruminicola Tc2-24]|uniref:Membrane protein involved in the export of O-antigen and teichoic acid n=1 Tax=Prevotella aff. ruminicola Tc2-24 TaxID=81582 RepID=A0A1I0NEP0_9BACT|nr:lipopolysaccharide biosynthesis protein [Prevotella aff. ruminicola Tc2-24]SEV99885.1 Membrane protein involved in the export of O-antigen and teichoic acid [Prevotella aff. ruminicola Tc2-24]
MSESLKEKTAKGLFWGGMNNGMQQLLGFVFGIILGRLLSPSDYGLIAMIMIFSLIATALQNSGFSTALVNQKEPKDSDYNAVFWFNILMGGGIYLILFFSAPLIADYYHEPRLVALCRYAFIGLLFSCSGVAQAAYLFKNLRAKQLAKASITATVISSSVAVVMAWQGFSYWSLATQTNLFILISTLLRWHYSDWRPSWTVDFSFIRRAFPFSVKILISDILTHVNNNVMNILLGRYYSAHDTGNYNQAYQWNNKCTSLIQGMVKQVDQAVLVSVRDDQGRQLAVLRKLVRFAAFISFPLLLGFGLVAKEFIVLAIGEKWLVSATYLQWLCVCGAVLPLSTLLADLIISKGKSGTFMGCTLALGVLEILAMLVLYPYGIRTMILAYVALNLAWLFVWFFFANRLTDYSFLLFLKDIIPFALAATTVMLFTGYLTDYVVNRLLTVDDYTALWLLLVSRSIIAALLYLLVMKAARATILDECIQFLFHRRR